MRAARTAARIPFIWSWVFQTMSFALPLERLYETANLLAFRHPAPSYPFHVLLVPRRHIASLADLNLAQDNLFLTDVFNAVQILVKRHHLAEGGYRLIANGGAYQDFPTLHFHLVADRDPSGQ